MMDWLYLTPESIAVLVQPILAGCLAIYFVRLPEKTRATWLLAGMFATLACLKASSLLVNTTFGSLPPLFFQQLQFAFAFPCLVLLIAFAYAFPDDVHPRESRYVVRGSAVVSAVAVGHVVFQLATQRPDASLYYLISAMVLIAVAFSIFLRKARLPGQMGHAHRAFTFTFLLVFLSLLPPTFAVAGMLDPGVSGLLHNLLFLLFFAAFSLVYVNHAPHPTSLQVKLTGLSLFTVLVVLSIVSIITFPAPVMQREHGVQLPSYVSLHFAPDGEGGYRVKQVPFHFEPDLGDRLVSEDGQPLRVSLDFTFPLYGRPWRDVYVDPNGLVTFGGEMQRWTLSEFYTPLPKIAPFYVGLRETEEGGVYVKRAPDRLTVTWRDMTYSNSRVPARNSNTVQLILLADGAFTFNYERIEATATFGIRGVHPGGPVADRTVLTSPVTALAAGPSLVEEFLYTYRQRLHARMLPLIYSLFGATAFILLVFPLFFRTSLVQPLNRLLGGVRRVNAGDLDAEVPVGVRDEIGRLTEHFNQMTGSLQEAHHALKDYAERLEEMVDERTGQIARQNEQLARQAERLRDLDEAKTTFFANLSHEFRTPLTLILGPLEQALKQEKPLSQAERALMLRNGRRLLRLINQILDLARLEAGSLTLDRRRVDLVPFVRRHVSLFHSLAASHGIDLRFATEAAACPVPIDAEQMEKVVGNLLSNALKFTPEGGRVTATVSCAEEEATIAVRDTGPGIAADKLPHLFDRFYQADDAPTRAYEGTGIGLALVKEVVTLHGGTVTVESTPGMGSTFTVRIPSGPASEMLTEDATAGAAGNGHAAALASDAVPTAVPLPVDAGPHAADETTDRTTVLVVEDNPDLRAFIRSVLEPAFRVVEAGDGAEGLEKAREALPDLILADVMMPKMDGFALSRALKDDAATDCIPVVLLTARAGAEDRIEGLTTGADTYLTKPFKAEALRLQVGNLIARQHRLRKRLQQGAAPAEADPPPRSAFEAQVRAAVEAHLADPAFSVERLAGEVAMSRQHLHRRLTEETGTTPVQYIRRVRLEQAARLLRERQGNVSEVAYAVGFNSLSYFGACFREHFGTAPSAYPSPA